MKDMKFAKLWEPNMSNIWIISDTHFQHSNMLKFTNEDGSLVRPGFSSASEVDELMIENWNSVVKPQDHVWHLGDVFMGDPLKFDEIWAKLHGKKQLIVGNHDDIRYLSGKSYAGNWFFHKIHMWKFMPGLDAILTHVPMQLDNTFEGKRKVTFNVHGHIHSNKSPTLRHFNASVEPNDYKPIHVEDLRKILNARKSSL